MFIHSKMITAQWVCNPLITARYLLLGVSCDVSSHRRAATTLFATLYNKRFDLKNLWQLNAIVTLPNTNASKKLQRRYSRPNTTQVPCNRIPQYLQVEYIGDNRHLIQTDLMWHIDTWQLFLKLYNSNRANLWSNAFITHMLCIYYRKFEID